MKKNSIRTFVHKIGFKVKKHSPEILVVAGVVGVVASTVLACKATMKVSAILEETKENLEKIHMVQQDEQYADKYSPEDARKDLTILYVQTGMKLVKLYAPAVALGVISISTILTSNHILRKRNAALAAAYATVDKSFKEYRNRVAERFGKEAEQEIRHNIKTVQQTTTDEDGNEQTTEIKVATHSEYAKFFDEGSKAWEKNAEYNLMFLKAQQNYANDKLKAHGHLFLNEVYDMLDIPRTKAGQVVGWIYDEKNPIGDNYVDFGLYDTYRETSRNFVNGYERSILLDFNVDGNIWDLM